MRDVAVTACVVTLGLAALAAVSGRAYASLPGVGAAASPSASSAVATSPHGPEPACAACHRAHTALSSPLLVESESDSSVCTRCHNATGAPEKSPHSNMDIADPPQQFYVSCAQCHDPHGDPDALGGNKAMIRTDIAGLAVNFHTSSGPDDSFDDGMGDALHDSICVVCHTTTSHNNVNSRELVDEGHGPVGTDCTSCHKHGSSATSLSGFMPDTATATATATSTPAPTDTPTPTETPTETPPETPTPTPTP
jgi:predicted CXXCH cytochrome family protein